MLNRFLSKMYIAGFWWACDLSFYANVQRIYKNGDFTVWNIAWHNNGNPQNIAVQTWWWFWF